MCTNPITHNGNTFACRVCDACIAARRASWVSRAMAEMATSPYTFVLTLTYNDEDQANRDGAAMFNYLHVREFLKRLLAAVNPRGDKGHFVRFLVAGEQGSRHGRCHWHVILYSDCDLLKVGQIINRYGKSVSNDEDIMSVGKRIKRLKWSTWGRGFVVFQPANEASFNYCLSYVLKDQFTNEKSFGTARAGKGEVFGTGLFRMSKRPAIGAVYLMQWIGEHLNRLSVPVNLQIKIPGKGGFFYPAGGLRRRILWSLVAINQLAVWRSGRPSPQFSTLVANSAKNESDIGILLNEPEEIETIERFAKQISIRQSERQRTLQGFAIRARCGGELACAECCAQFDEVDRRANQVEHVGIVRETLSLTNETCSERQANYQGRCNSYCRASAVADQSGAFGPYFAGFQERSVGMQAKARSIDGR